MRETQRARRDRMVGVKVTDEEHELLRRLAFEERKSVGGFVRDVVLERARRATKRSK